MWIVLIKEIGIGRGFMAFQNAVKFTRPWSNSWFPNVPIWKFIARSACIVDSWANSVELAGEAQTIIPASTGEWPARLSVLALFEPGFAPGPMSA